MQDIKWKLSLEQPQSATRKPNRRTGLKILKTTVPKNNLADNDLRLTGNKRH